jgi:hypothetical protein
MQKNNIRLYGVLSHAIDSVWPDASKLLEKAVNYADGKYALTDIYQAIKNRDMQLWVAFDDVGMCAACVTQIICYPRKKVLFLLFSGGMRFEKWMHLTYDMVAFAKEHGCSSVELHGRPGWEKKGKPVGFKKVYTVYQVEMMT